MTKSAAVLAETNTKYEDSQKKLVEIESELMIERESLNNVVEVRIYLLLC